MKRFSYIDIAKAFAIIFIVIGHTLVHSTHCYQIFKLMYSFHVMLFIILSGYTFKINEKMKYKEFVKKKFYRIMTPYFIWGFIFMIPYLIFGTNIENSLNTKSSFDIINNISNTIYGNGNMSNLKQNSSLWFLPALFTIEVSYYWIIKLINNKKNLTIVVITTLILIGYYSSTYLNIYFPWGINTMLNIGVVFLIGYLIKEKFKYTKEFSYLRVIILIVVGAISCYYNSIVSCINYEYGNYALALISGISFSIVIISISNKIYQNFFLEYIGKNTMGILIFHKIIIILFQTKFGKISLLLDNSNIYIEFLLSIIIVILSIIISLILAKIVKKLFPALLGEKKLS